MDWQIDPRRKLYVRKLTSTLSEVIGRLTTPSDAIIPSIPSILSLINLFANLGQADWEYAPSSLRLTESKVRKIPSEILNWAVNEGLIIAIERKGAVIAYRINDAWQDWMLQYATPKDLELSIDWSKLDTVFEKYGRLGLRIAAQLAFGNSHALDSLKIPDPYKEKVWIWRDAVLSGANVVRVGGHISIQTPYVTYSDRWTPPGHFIWSWDIAEMFPDKLSIGNRILVVENPYAYWHMLKHFSGQGWTFICLHGETRQPRFLSEDADLHRLFQLIINRYPVSMFEIWCDPDPGGLVMATNALNMIQELGGKASFCMMDGKALNKIETLVISENRLLPLDDNDISILKSGPIHQDLMPLSHEIEKRQKKGEQECLALVFQND